MMGYCPNGYRLWSIEKNKIILSRDVRFNEVSYPFMEKRKSDSPKEIVVCRMEQEREEEEEENVPLTNESTDDGGIPNEAGEEVNEPGAETLTSDAAPRSPILRRSTRLSRPPIRFTDMYNSLFEACCESSTKIPNTYSDIQNCHDKKEWLIAVNEELEAMRKNNVWIQVPKPDNIKPLKSRWIFRIKEDAFGNPTRYKARLVAKGYLQKEFIDYDETYAPVAKFSTIRTLLAVGVFRSMHFHQMDVKTAFLYGDLEEDIYLQIPEGMKESPNDVLKLKKSLYGLKQSPRCWNTKFNNILLKFGFSRSMHDACLYIKLSAGHDIFIIIYVDDVLIVGETNEDVCNLKSKLCQVFEMTDCGLLTHYLGTAIEYDRVTGVMKLSQISSTQKILNSFGMDDSKPMSTPMEKGLILEPETQESTNYPYRELLGKLMYLMLWVRPDLCYSVGYLGRFQQYPSETHWTSLKRVLRYLKGTSGLKLEFRKNTKAEKVVGYADANWASHSHDRKSTSGYIFFVYGCPVSWCSKKQQTVALSSSEAEYVAMSAAVSEGMWLRGILQDLNVLASDEAITIYEDNAGSIAMAKNMECKRSKHIDIKHHFLRDHVNKGHINIMYISTQEQVADIFTKPLDRSLFNCIRSKLFLN